ncbi:MAG: glycogen synthase [Kosmotogaceae bacterium]|nr:glycogen synthase [Kosmotogaceae bacterium]
MKVLFVSYEVYPIAKVGGLADVAGSLPKYLKELGVEIDLLMPFHKSIDRNLAIRMDKHIKTRFVKREFSFDVSRMELPKSDVNVFLFDNERLMDSEEIYGASDFGLQAMCFSDAASGFAVEQGYNIVHLNDWQTGLIAVYLKHSEAECKTVFSIHNLAYQGSYGKEYLDLSGIDENYWNEISEEGKINFLKAGLVFSDKLSTVSPTYAKEIQTKEYGAGLENILSRRRSDLVGILNGIDYNEYDPERDGRLWTNFCQDNIESKKSNKANLQQLLGLPKKDDALIGLISRLVDQKGLDLIEDIKDELMKLPVQIVVLGTGESKYEDMFKMLQKNYPEKVAARLTFDLDLAQKIYGGADMFLMPSRYEPCGLGQMFAMRYGTIPVVRYTGGLADTVHEFDPENNGNGFGFVEYSAEKLLEALKKALSVYNQPELWKKAVRNAMRQDFSWGVSATNYLSLYKKILEASSDA